MSGGDLDISNTTLHRNIHSDHRSGREVVLMVWWNCPYYYEDDDVRLCQKKPGYLQDCAGCPEMEGDDGDDSGLLHDDV